MQPMQTLIAAAGWTSFSGVFSTVFPLVVLIAVLTAYAVVSRKQP
jgi:presenilin-like A22 family membrane protease